MQPPITRRIDARATLYIEETGDRVEVTRIVLDCPLPEAACILANIPSPFDTDPEEDTGPWTQAEEAAAAAALEAFPGGCLDDGWEQGVPF